MLSAPLWCGLAAAFSVAAGPRMPALQSGDVVLQTSHSAQSAAIQQATHSPFSHVGVVEVADDGVFVIEAIQPVSRTPVARWRARGAGGKWTVLRRPDLTDEAAAKVVGEAKKMLGRPYDLLLRWDDERLYCSELVAKAFQRGAGISVGKMQKVRDLDLRGLLPAIQKRYGPAVPLDQELLTPASIAGDPGFTVLEDDFVTRSAKGSAEDRRPAHRAGRAR